MFSKKKTECRVCGYRFTPERENIYTAEEPRSMADMLTKAPTRFSAVDCPICGCQIALAIRVPRVDISDNAERHDADALNIPASPYPDGLSQSWDRGGAVFCNPPYGREIGKWVQKAFEEARGVSDCFTYPSADRHSIFSRLHLRESGNPLRARAATVHGRRRERRRSRALPVNGSYL